MKYIDRVQLKTPIQNFKTSDKIPCIFTKVPNNNYCRAKFLSFPKSFNKQGWLNW